VLLTLCHPLDYLVWIFGEVLQVQGMRTRGLGLDVDAVVEATIHFLSGVLASVHLDYLQKPPEHSLTIIAEQGKLRWNGINGDLEIESKQADNPVRESPPEGFERNDLFLSEMRHFISVIEGSEEPVCTLQQGILVQQMIEQIRASFHRQSS
jgi:predicted dehydrogenase